MARPILFSSVSREKFDSLPDSDKAKKNYQIKEEDGTVSKYISNLEGRAGGGKFFETTEAKNKLVTVNSAEEIIDYWNTKGAFTVVGVTHLNGMDINFKVAPDFFASRSDEADYKFFGNLGTCDPILTFASHPIEGYENSFVVGVFD